jgi:beta-lactamase regulating signal transducer with metallopeptidase domain
MIVTPPVSALIAVTVGIVLVTLLRRPWRKLFSAEHAHALWLAVPLAIAVAWLPHSAMRPTVVKTPAAAHDRAVATPNAAGDTAGIFAPTMEQTLTGAWILGGVLWLGFVIVAQQRYAGRLRDARLTAMPGVRTRVLIASHTRVGPALIGAWRPRIVLPSDFEQRFAALERLLIIRHEAIHARRGDVLWTLVAQCLGAALWFHPLAWWALRAFRQDQELACDAAVVREYPDARRIYAEAMLKTHDATFLPIGCTWKSRHPLTERIAMLKAATPSQRRRSSARLVLPAALLVIVGAAYASSPATSTTAPARHQLDIRLDQAGQLLSAPTICLFDGAVATVSDVGKSGEDAWELGFKVMPTTGDTLRVDVDASFGKGNARKRSQQTAQGKVGQTMSLSFAGDAGSGAHTVAFTTTSGCPAGAPNKLVLITQKTHHGTARATASALASRGGLILVNVDALDEQPVAFNFEHMDARDAIRQLAEIDGRTATFEGARVTFGMKPPQ